MSKGYDDMVQNFGDETREALLLHNYSEQDIAWIGDNYGKYEVSIEEFFKAADDFDYDSGWGHPEVPLDLIIMFKDGCCLCRQEYDGSEWWYLQVCKRRPRNLIKGKLDFHRKSKDSFLPTLAEKLEL